MLGMEHFDRQHLQLHEVLEEMLVAMREGRASTQMRSLLPRMRALIVRHFQDEEKMMAEIAFPLLPIHQTLHREFMGRVAGFKALLDAGDPTAVLQTVAGFKAWIGEHISTADRAYSEYFKAKQGPANT